ncbi:hypothetical protein Tco_0154768 [Tanacetum coccineum]
MLLEQLSNHTLRNLKKKAQEERKLYIDVVKKSVKYIIKDEVKSQLHHILPKKVSNFATAVIQSTINESLKNILLDKIEKRKSYQAATEHKELYDGVVKSYNLDKDLFLSYGNVYSLTRDREDKNKDEDPPAGSNQGLKKQKTNKDAEPPKGSKSKESKYPKAPSLSLNHLEDQGSEFGHTDDQPDVEAAPKHDCFKKPDKPLTPNCHEYPFDLSKPLPLIKVQGRQVVPTDYFFNNDLEYLKGGNSSMKYTTSTTKTKAAKYDNIKGIKDMVPTLWSPVKYKRNMLIRSDELYKFCDGMLTSIINVLHDIANNLRIEYFQKEDVIT